MTASPELDWALKVGGSGVFWTVAYILIIKRGSQDKTFGMPLTALYANIRCAPHPRNLGAGCAALPPMARRRVRMRSLLPLWRASAPRLSRIASRLPGSTRLRLLSMARSVRKIENHIVSGSKKGCLLA